jgi:hypothetical protein
MTNEYSNEYSKEKPIETEDGVFVGVGDQVYSYYDHSDETGLTTIKAIEPFPAPVEYFEPGGPWREHDRPHTQTPWADLANGEHMNGQRLCSVEGARKKGWIK